MSKEPYMLLVGSHKGGTGQTTGALALAQILGATGMRVVVWDADPVHAASLIGLDMQGECPWPNVEIRQAPPDAPPPFDADVVVIDGPALTERAAQHLLKLAHGVVLTCLADPLSLRTVRSAARAIHEGRQSNPKLELVGILISLFNPAESLHVEMLELIRKDYRHLLLEPPVPFQSEVSNWPLTPGSPLPAGIAREAYDLATKRVVQKIQARRSASARS